MSKHKFIAVISGLMVFIFSLQTAQADPSTLAEEFNYFLEYGRHSPNFYPNILTEKDEGTKATILKLQQQEENRRWWSAQDKQKAAKAWFSLSEQCESDVPSNILYLSKTLEIQWDGETAIALADRCHHLAQAQDDLKTKIKLAYRGFATLGVNLKEPNYDYHQKLRTAPQVIGLLEDLKASTVSIRSASDLPLPLSDEIFHKDCIPQAEVCSLLAVGYSADILVGLPDTSEAQRNVYQNRSEALTLYQKGLQGQATPEQREYYHKQVVNLTLGLIRTSGGAGSEGVQYAKLMKISALALARTFKDAHKESAGFLNSTELAYKTALAYFYAGKWEKALKYINIISAVPQEDSERGVCNRIKILCENLGLQLEDPDNVFEHQVKNLNVFLR